MAKCGKKMIKYNYLIINKKPQRFSEMRLAGKTAVFLNGEGRPLDFGVLPLDSSIYTMMNCDQVQLMMLVIDKAGGQTVEGIFWKDEEEYSSGCRRLAETAGLKISKQDLRINSYAWSIAEKLRDGVQIKVTDALDTSDMEVCPECGMLNPKGSPYCLDCGAEIG